MLKKGLLIAGLIAVIAGLAVATTVYAEGRGPRGQRGPGGQGEAAFPEMHEAVSTALAGFLGLSTEELEAAQADGETPRSLAEAAGLEIDDLHAAMQEAHEAWIAQAVEDGTLTQEQAEALLERRGSSGPRGGKNRRGMQGSGDFGYRQFHDQKLTALAGFLGLSEEALQDALEGGETIASLAEAQGLDLEELRAAMEQAREEAIAQAVADGEMTQEQADALLEHLGKRPGGPGTGRRPGGHGGFGPGPGRGPGRGPSGPNGS